MIPSAKALLLSSVSYMDGHSVDLVKAGSLCRARGVDLVVDGSQSLGVEPVDLQEAEVAFFCGPVFPSFSVIFNRKMPFPRAF